MELLWDWDTLRSGTMLPPCRLSRSSRSIILAAICPPLTPGAI